MIKWIQIIFKCLLLLSDEMRQRLSKLLTTLLVWRKRESSFESPKVLLGIFNNRLANHFFLILNMMCFFSSHFSLTPIHIYIYFAIGFRFESHKSLGLAKWIYMVNEYNGWDFSDFRPHPRFSIPSKCRNGNCIHNTLLACLFAWSFLWTSEQHLSCRRVKIPCKLASFGWIRFQLIKSKHSS